MKDEALWARLQAHPFDATEGSQPFSVKLAEAEGWKPAYTQRVIEEYRRFLYLCTLSENPVTPSEAVDRAWHMHLTFSRDYWEVLCKEVLKKPLHHDPCAGEEDMPLYEAQYRDTRAMYQVEFKEAPPGDIWPETAPEPAKTGALHIAVGLSLVGLLGLFALTGENVFWFAAVFSALLYLVWLIGRNSHKSGRHGHTSAGCGGGSAGCGGGGCGGGG